MIINLPDSIEPDWTLALPQTPPRPSLTFERKNKRPLLVTPTQTFKDRIYNPSSSSSNNFQYSSSPISFYDSTTASCNSLLPSPTFFSPPTISYSTPIKQLNSTSSSSSSNSSTGRNYFNSPLKRSPASKNLNNLTSSAFAEEREVESFEREEIYENVISRGKVLEWKFGSGKRDRASTSKIYNSSPSKNIETRRGSYGLGIEGITSSPENNLGEEEFGDDEMRRALSEEAQFPSTPPLTSSPFKSNLQTKFKPIFIRPLPSSNFSSSSSINLPFSPSVTSSILWD